MTSSLSANANSLLVKVTADNYKTTTKLKSYAEDVFHFSTQSFSFNKIVITTTNIGDDGSVINQHQDAIEHLPDDLDPAILSFNFDTKRISFGGDYYETEPLDENGYFRVLTDYSPRTLIDDLSELLDKNKTSEFTKVCYRVNVPQVVCRFNKEHSLECEIRNISVSFLYTNKSCPKSF